MSRGYSELRNQLVCAADGVDYAYRDTGGRASGCRWSCTSTSAGTALIDALASTRRVITFDNAGVGGSTGTTPDTIEQMPATPSR
jgi:pimeloyl-ACP methyl ester carboxylesterase